MRKRSLCCIARIMNFKAVLGQEKVKEQLRNMQAEGRMPHAILLEGPAGSGKLPLALALARFLLCEKPEKEDCCEQCRACRKTAEYVHPDFHFSFPVVGSKATSDDFLPMWREALKQSPYMSLHDWLQRIGAENKQGNINKEECVLISRKLSFQPYESDKKVMLIWMAEALGKEGNRLLKLIEEPPHNTHFILVAEEAEALLSTILSRCQRLSLNRLSTEELSQGLENRGVPKAKAEEIALLADGNFRLALQWASEAEEEEGKLFVEWLRKCYVGKVPELIGWSEKLAALGREHQKHLLQYGLEFVRQMLHGRMSGGQIPVRLPANEKQAAERLAPLLTFGQLEELSQLLNNSFHGIQRNAYAKVLFLHASLSIHRIMKKSATKDLKAKGYR